MKSTESPEHREPPSPKRGGAPRGGGVRVSIGIDVEPDCPPYLDTQYRGIETGLPTVLDLLRGAGVSVTCFCTGTVASRYPRAVERILADGHELGCHGHTHRRFDRMTVAESAADLDAAFAALRAFGVPVTSFRAPNLRFPASRLSLLEERGVSVDSSQAKYKVEYYRNRSSPARLTRIPVSMTSSVLRLDPWLRDPWLRALSDPIVLFVHPWEYVDLTRERLRLDCRFRTGAPALRALEDVITLFREHSARFLTMRALAATLHDHAAPAAA